MKQAQKNLKLLEEAQKELEALKDPERFMPNIGNIARKQYLHGNVIHEAKKRSKRRAQRTFKKMKNTYRRKKFQNNLQNTKHRLNVIDPEWEEARAQETLLNKMRKAPETLSNTIRKGINELMGRISNPRGAEGKKNKKSRKVISRSLNKKRKRRKSSKKKQKK